MLAGGKILAEILRKLSEAVMPGISTQDLDNLAVELTKKSGVKPAFLGYGGYPAALCTSVNDEVVHCVPSGRQLKEGEIVSLDMGIIFKSFYLDSAITVPVAPLSGASQTGLLDEDYKVWARFNPKLHMLLQATKEALNAGIKQARIGKRIGDISHAIQHTVESYGFNVVRDLVGHGIGRELHEEPQVPNFGQSGQGLELQEGLVIAIEPMVVAGDWRLVQGEDGFSYCTKDKSYAAHFEHTVAITQDGPLVLTK